MRRVLGAALRGGFEGDARCVSPEVFQPVKGAGPRVQQMHDNFPAVHEDPLEFVEGARTPEGDGRTLYVPHRASLAGERGLEMIPNCGKLRCAVGGADHEEIGNRGKRTQIHDENIFRVLLECGTRRKERRGVAFDGPRDDQDPMIRYSPVPEVGQRPFMAARPFFILTCLASFISRLALHFTQYASITPP